MHPQLRPIKQGLLGASVADVPGVGALCSTPPRAAPHPTIKTNRPALARSATSDLPMFVITSNCRRAGRPMQRKRSTQARRARCNRQGLRSMSHLLGARRHWHRGAATNHSTPGLGRRSPYPPIEVTHKARIVRVGIPTRCRGSRRARNAHAQVAALAAAVEYLPEVVRFLANTGLRWGEMAALRVCEFDMLRRRVNVSRSVTEFNGLVWSTPRTHERRSVPFPASLADELAALMVGKGRDALVFTTGLGGVLRVSNYRKRFFAPPVAACQKVDERFPTITPHDLRHTAASLVVSAGANVKAVQRMLGHAKASMTLDVYADLFDDDLDDVADSHDAAIGSAVAVRLRSEPAK